MAWRPSSPGDALADQPLGIEYGRVKPIKICTHYHECDVTTFADPGPLMHCMTCHAEWITLPLFVSSLGRWHQ